MRVALFHPGKMGSRLGGELVSAGHEVVWVPEGRSSASAERAGAAGLTPTSFADALTADVVLCSCVPQGAVDIARRVGAAGFTGLYVEANPMSPTSLAEARAAMAPGATFVDAGVIGPPPVGGSSPTHLVLSGDAADEVAALWAGTAVTTLVAGKEVGAASAAKSSYALYNKGKAALSVLAFELAAKHGVTDVLVAQQVRQDASALADPGTLDRLREVAWRWGPEFDELAETLDAAGLEGDAARALREVWTRLSQ
jgi:3-hydroxyisobutyrate dehydrogenase-like beta-hydroxyacid dehydrogenase